MTELQTQTIQLFTIHCTISSKVLGSIGVPHIGTNGVTLSRSCSREHLCISKVVTTASLIEIKPLQLSFNKTETHLDRFTLGMQSNVHVPKVYAFEYIQKITQI